MLFYFWILPGPATEPPVGRQEASALTLPFQTAACDSDVTLQKHKIYAHRPYRKRISASNSPTSLKKAENKIIFATVSGAIAFARSSPAFAVECGKTVTDHKTRRVAVLCGT